LRGTPIAFGVSGYSGAGRTPTERNDPERLRDNLLPYHLVGHQHEREVERHLGHAVRLLPHVAEFFRGISLTIRFELESDHAITALQNAYAHCFRDAACVHFDSAVPEVRAVRGTPHCRLGGLARDDNGGWVIVSVLDNLSKGAATQAVQNANLMFGLEREMGLHCG
jgi:N-acetyl-gamma-glutamylphosphate reductase